MVGRAVLSEDQAGVLFTFFQTFPDWIVPAHPRTPFDAGFSW
jgi:hypothetical protein